MNDLETINRIYKWADKKRSKYNAEYQMGGSPSTLKTFERYDDICDICLAAERAVSEEDIAKKHLHKNQAHMIEQLKDIQRAAPGKTFTYEEVERWMRKMML